MKTRINRSIVAASICAGLFSISSNNVSAGTDTFIGEIMFAGFNFCPRGYAEANGQLLAISQNAALFSLLGTQYGGDGRTTFGLPDLRGRSAVGSGQGTGLTKIRMGQKGGAESFTLTTAQLPSHTHAATLHGTDTNANSPSPNGTLLANGNRDDLYNNSATTTVNLNASSVSVGNTGGGQAVSKRSPFVAVKACIAVQGIFPSRN